VAYSYFDETGTPPTDGAGIDPVHDLVWGMSVDTKIEDETEAARTVTIHMTHKFARVKVRIKSSITGANIAYLNGIAIDGGQTAGLNLFTGNITGRGSVNQDMGLSGNYSAGEVASEYRTVKPVASPTRVRIGSVRVNTSNTTFSGTVDIGLALNGATSYNLLVEVKKYPTIFAYSNVVWNGSKLTFATTAGENSTVAAGVQGVFFKWGSLVAVSPVGSGYVAGSSIVYSPTGINNYAWGSIPYADETGAPFANDAATDDDFATYNGSLGYNATTGKGDICRYISAQGWVSGSWRLPKGSELTALMGEKTPGYYGTRTYLVTPSGGSNAYGYYQPDAGAILGNENLCVPASGTFTMTGVSSPDGKYPGFVGAQGYFHSGSSSGGSDSFYLSVSMSPNIDPHIVLVLTGGRPSGVPIRCIRIN
jgi:hypothetical protein